VVDSREVIKLALTAHLAARDIGSYYVHTGTACRGSEKSDGVPNTEVVQDTDHVTHGAYGKGDR
jgi:hypothetical protein